MDLRGNPLTSMLRYREHVIGSCCYLNMVDGKSIEPRSRIMMVNLHKMRLRKNLMSLIPSMDLCGSKGFKVTSSQSWRSQEKVCRPAPAPLEPVGPDSSCTGVKSFSKFDGQSFCSPLTYRPQIFSIERSTTF